MRKRLLPFFLFLTLACAYPLAGFSIDVSSVADLESIATQAASDGCAGQVIHLKADLDLNGATWSPIGTAAHPFVGTFHGHGHMIKGLRAFNGSLDGSGLFGHVGQDGVIDSLGISGGNVIAKASGRRRIGVIAGVCDGTIRQCWSMATIVAAGNVCGGLVGELTAHGLIEDCYHSGLILNGADTLGSVVGYNHGGQLTRVYDVGYAKNGRVMVHTDNGGVYDECYYDRKLYYPEKSVTSPDIIPVDNTKQLFSIFANQSAWIQANNHYPTLRAFSQTNNAVLLSVAPMFIDSLSTDPVNHANDLTENFELSSLATWACQDVDDERWIKINNSTHKVTVIRPCSETDVLVNATRGAEQRTVYMRPRRWTDFQPGAAGAADKEFCFEEEASISQEIQMIDAKYGWEKGRYYYLMQRLTVNAAGDTIPLDTLYNGEKTETTFIEWRSSAKLPTDQAGVFVIRRFAHDSVCVTDWMRSNGQFVYRVYEEFKPGKIQDGKDTVYLPTTISVASIEAATGGKAPITYTWKVNGVVIPSSNTEALTSYAGITTAGEYTFIRQAKDDKNCSQGNETAEGKFTVLVLDPFNPGQVNKVENLRFCTVDLATAHVIKGSLPTGGLPDYHYQWYRVKGTDTTAITGATGKDLPLNMPVLGLEAGHDYTYIRKATDDTHKLPYMLCDNEQRIHIMAELSAGSITSETRSNYCAEAGDNDNSLIHVTIEGTAATGESTLEYQWIRTVDGVSEVITNSGSQNLNASFTLGDVRGKTYEYTREVRNHPDCEWFPSSGTVTQYYGQETRTEIIKTICKEQLPYEMTWIDGSKHKFTADGESWEVSDKTGPCKADTIFTIHTVSMPVFTIQDTAHLCQETGTISVNFQQTAGLSNVFRITYSPYLATLIGRPDTTGVITANGTVLLRNLPSIGSGECYLDVQIGYSGKSSASDEEICYSDAHRMYLDVSLGGYVHTKYDRVLFVDNNPDSNRVEGMTEKLRFVSYQWYKNGEKLKGETNQYYHEGGKLLEGVFYVVLLDNKGHAYRSCDVELWPDGSAAPALSSVYPVPVNTGEPITVEGVGTAQILSFSGERVSAAVPVEGRVTLTAPPVTGLYYVQVISEEGVMEMHKIIVK